MFHRHTVVKGIFATIAAWLISPTSVSAQYTWTVNKPTANGTYAVGKVEIDIECSWLTVMSTAVSRVDVEIRINDVDRAGTTSNATFSTVTTGEGMQKKSTYYFTEEIEAKTQNPNSKATVKFIARNSTNGILIRIA